MAIIVKTAAPNKLLADIKSAIDEGKVETWQYDSDGDFTHSPEQWRWKAWLRPRLETGELVFTTVTPQGERMSSRVYGVYHGRFVEMLLVHFDMDFSEVASSALPARGDIVSPS